MRIKFLIFIVLIIVSCKSEREIVISSNPEITRVYTEICDFLYGEEIPAQITFYVYLEDYRTINKIMSIKITDPEGVTWNWNKTDLDNNWNSEEGYFYLSYNKTSVHKDYIPLGNYEIKMKLINNTFKTTNFTVYGRGNLNLNSGRLYSQKSENEPKILIKPDSIEIKKDDDYIKIIFNNNDSIINDCYLWLYDENNTYLKNTDWFSKYHKIISNKNEFKLSLKDFENVSYITFITVSRDDYLTENTTRYIQIIDNYPINPEKTTDDDITNQIDQN